MIDLASRTLSKSVMDTPPGELVSHTETSL
jgi:hypothetical protein